MVENNPIAEKKEKDKLTGDFLFNLRKINKLH
jgi:hypothetical protein